MTFYSLHLRNKIDKKQKKRRLFSHVFIISVYNSVGLMAIHTQHALSVQLYSDGHIRQDSLLRSNTVTRCGYASINTTALCLQVVVKYLFALLQEKSLSVQDQNMNPLPFIW